jgi:hypothetical protein
MDGLLLGHWYLTDRGLTRTPIDRYTTVLLVAVVVEAVALLLGGFGPTGGSSGFNPLLTSAGLASWIAIGMVGTTALIAVLIRAALRGERSSAVQAATGFFYLAVITALTAEFAPGPLPSHRDVAGVDGVTGLVAEDCLVWVVAARRCSVRADDAGTASGPLSLVVDPPSSQARVWPRPRRARELGAGVIPYLAALAFGGLVCHACWAALMLSLPPVRPMPEEGS